MIALSQRRHYVKASNSKILHLNNEADLKWNISIGKIFQGKFQHFIFSLQFLDQNPKIWLESHKFFVPYIVPVFTTLCGGE